MEKYLPGGELADEPGEPDSGLKNTMLLVCLVCWIVLGFGLRGVLRAEGNWVLIGLAGLVAYKYQHLLLPS